MGAVVAPVRAPRVVWRAACVSRGGADGQGSALVAPPCAEVDVVVEMSGNTALVRTRTETSRWIWRWRPGGVTRIAGLMYGSDCRRFSRLRWLQGHAQRCRLGADGGTPVVTRWRP